MIALWIALAGGIGAAARLGVDGVVRSHTPGGFPWATATVNLTGSFLLGLVVGSALGDTWTSTLGTGFLGGYTTFSTASFETARLALDRRYAAALAYGAGVLVLGVAAAAAGYIVGRQL